MPKKKTILLPKANNGSNDFLLMQMAKNLGYKIALLNMKDRFYE
jgi:hypothetical protein